MKWWKTLLIKYKSWLNDVFIYHLCRNHTNMIHYHRHNHHSHLRLLLLREILHLRISMIFTSIFHAHLFHQKGDMQLYTRAFLVRTFFVGPLLLLLYFHHMNDMDQYMPDYKNKLSFWMAYIPYNSCISYPFALYNVI